MTAGFRIVSCFFAVSPLYAAPNLPVADNGPFRFALSDKVLRGVSLNDARAALAVWSAEIGQAAGIKLASQQNMVLPSDQLLASIRNGVVDLFCLTVEEYRQVAPYVDTNRILGDDYGGDELVLVVREGSGIAGLSDLRGRSLIFLDSPNSFLAESWLAVSFWKDGRDSPQQFLGRISHNVKLAQVVLPVFFGQADACVVTHRGLNTMFELNPQLAKKLHILLASPKVASAFFACRKDYVTRGGKPIMDRLMDVRSSPAARQVLTLFQSPGFAIHDGEYLRTANAILDTYEHHHK